jgi:hypothetical protein
MMRFGLMGAMPLSLTLALAVPAMAGDTQSTATTQHAKRQVRNVPTQPNPNNIYDPNLPIENALRWGYSQGYSNYPSGFGGLYGDGRYPGNTISNKNYPTWW